MADGLDGATADAVVLPATGLRIPMSQMLGLPDMGALPRVPVMSARLHAPVTSAHHRVHVTGAPFDAHVLPSDTFTVRPPLMTASLRLPLLPLPNGDGPYSQMATTVHTDTNSSVGTGTQAMTPTNQTQLPGNVVASDDGSSANAASEVQMDNVIQELSGLEVRAIEPMDVDETADATPKDSDGLYSYDQDAEGEDDPDEQGKQ
ncbi:hypothetical protein NEOLEDRAFT_1151704 [Neolentinus lepideus HHB14362 ss-1]|uniref:Uncharacterized protein n=1 Tax=Neolentinus lepideus HHB14362 ss-1 TaxID=1314782 RepID=A0A165NPC2_9AGAM|nr:hypothetical protein NEOLEDRAFT_1151704 [Neolentinus lepideus HHB14362 ss-1]